MFLNSKRRVILLHMTSGWNFRCLQGLILTVVHTVQELPQSSTRCVNKKAISTSHRWFKYTCALLQSQMFLEESMKKKLRNIRTRSVLIIYFAVLWSGFWFGLLWFFFQRTTKRPHFVCYTKPSEISPLLDQSLDLNERTEQMRWPVRVPGTVARCHNSLATCGWVPIQTPKPIKYIQKKMEAQTQQACKERPRQRGSCWDSEGNLSGSTVWEITPLCKNKPFV